ncbi:MAG: 50S ribosomal protein L5 [Fibromonadaceae bacterium]|jgi:large subunit ribosomal protein L5|nr:50S ribosomal protein L5 [Fibromonadaceae bacterium]
MSILKEMYKKEAVPALQKRFNYKNVMQVPRLRKIVLNIALSHEKINKDRKIVDEAANILTIITGQKAVITKAKNAIANFKLREGMSIGAKVTLNGGNMWDFLYRFVNVALPRVRDFRGIPQRGFDGNGNYSMGIKEQTVFVEIDIEKVTQTLGMDVIFVTSAKTDEEGRALLETLGLPFRKQQEVKPGEKQ